MDESAFDILESMMKSRDNDVIISSIKDSAARTAVMVSHVESMLGLYAAFCEKSPNKEIERRRYDVVWDMYIAEDTLPKRKICLKKMSMLTSGLQLKGSQHLFLAWMA